MTRMDWDRVRREDRAKAPKEAAFRENTPAGGGSRGKGRDTAAARAFFNVLFASGGRFTGEEGHPLEYFTALSAEAKQSRRRDSQWFSDAIRALDNLYRRTRGFALQPGSRVQARLIWRWRNLWLVWLNVNKSAWLDHAPGLKPDAEVTAVVVSQSPPIRLRLANPAEAEGPSPSASPLDPPDD